MQITDYNTNVSETTFTIERNDNQWGEVNIKDFFSFMRDWKGWFLEEAQLILIIPNQEMTYNKELKAFVLTDMNAKIYNWLTLCKEYSKELESFFEAYADEYNDKIEWDEVEEVIDEDPQEEAYQDFRKSQMI